MHLRGVSATADAPRRLFGWRLFPPAELLTAARRSRTSSPLRSAAEAFQPQSQPIYSEALALGLGGGPLTLG
jgi:hypothetical protein